MEEKILDYIPRTISTKEKKRQNYKWFHRFLILNFCHFSIVYCSFLYRVYHKVGHLPFYKNPHPMGLNKISYSWLIHDDWVNFCCYIAFFSIPFWATINLLYAYSYLRSKINKVNFESSIDWIPFGILSFIVAYKLFFSYSFSVLIWYSD